MTWASLKIYFVPIKYCLLSIVFDEFKNISENLGKSQLKMESPGIIWDSGQVARISGSAINPNFNENKEMSKLTDLRTQPHRWVVSQQKLNIVIKFKSGTC
jgi:hypothetical protein